MTRRPDLRLLLPAVGAWSGAALALRTPWWTLLAAAVTGVSMTWRRRRGGQPVALVAAVLVAGVSCGCVALLRAEAHAAGAVAAAARQEALVSATARLSGDPVHHGDGRGQFVTLRVTVRTLEWQGRVVRTHSPVLVIGRGDWEATELGDIVRVSGVLAPARTSELSAVLLVRRDPELLTKAGAVHRVAAAVRTSIRAACAGAGPVPRELVPALVVGDDAGLPDSVVEDFRIAGLTHLTAVSGTNLTLVVGFLLVMGRWLGVRGRGQVVLGIAGVAGFVLLARAEPSVVRAAAMGSVALLGMSSGGRERGVRVLGAAVVVLLLLDPWLAVSVGFALSVLATAGILLLAPPMRDALSRWLPRWASEAVAVPFAAHLACTPLVAAISGTVSLVGVAANLLVAAIVGPATVLGLLGGLIRFVSAPAGNLSGRLAGSCAAWIVLVAERSARLPAAALDWGAGAVSLAVLTALCLAIALLAPRYLARGPRTVAAAALLALAMVHPLPTPGWPPRGWVLVACDVGQGDGLVLNAGDGAAIVVDAGPDPTRIDRCLDRLRVDRVPVVVLTHFHADHVDGLPGVFQGRDVGEVLVTSLREPAFGADAVDRWSGAEQVAVRVPAYGEVARVGDVTWQVVGPAPSAPAVGGSAPNNASLALVVRAHDIALLLTGDIEPESQRALTRALGGLRVDVLKVPHHGSPHQDESFLTGLGARLALVSVGQDNDYGHPSELLLDRLRRAGMRVERTDLSGDLVVLVDGGQARVATRG